MTDTCECPPTTQLCRDDATGLHYCTACGRVYPDHWYRAWKHEQERDTPNRSYEGIVTVWDGVEYPSRAAAARALGVAESTFFNWLDKRKLRAAGD